MAFLSASKGCGRKGEGENMAKDRIYQAMKDIAKSKGVSRWLCDVALMSADKYAHLL